VGAKKPNPWGLCDIYGNVAEWCQDAWHLTYSGAPTDGSAWTAASGHNEVNFRITRGGSFADNEDGCQSPARLEGGRYAGGPRLGLRVVVEGDAPLARAAGLTAPPKPVAVTPAQRGGGAAITLNLGGGLTMKFAHIPAGSFIRGRAASIEDDANHLVTISKPFHMGVCEVTNAQFRQFKPDHNSGKGLNDDDQPAVNVGWGHAAYYMPGVTYTSPPNSFCVWLSKKTGKVVRLPTEAEWEYACRAGSQRRYSFGPDSAELGDYAWFADNADKKTHPVGTKKPNAWGLYDMHGNAREWTDDFWADGWDFPMKAVTDPRNGQSTHRLTRGGSYKRSAGSCRCDSRESEADVRDDVGFRVIIEQHAAR
jgi:formylglycine-generating enzyme required for sulfatase activity